MALANFEWQTQPPSAEHGPLFAEIYMTLALTFMQRTHIFIGIAGIVLSMQANAQFVPCGDKSLPPEQTWSPPNSAVSPRLMHFYGLNQKMSAAYNSSDPSSAESIAKEYLQVAKSFRCNWNFGNALHDANTVLGLLAIHAGKTEQAVQFLNAAGASSGSPQLNTFGPSMLLAQELAKAGNHAEVSSYLRSVKRFWEMDDGHIEQWVRELDAGGTPEFGKFARPL